MPLCRTYRYRLYPTAKQTQALERTLRHQCELYNAALEERRGAWSWERRSVSYVDQTRTLTGLRAVRPEVLECGVTVCRGTLTRLDRAFRAFYRRCKAGEAPGYPRFRSHARFDSLQWEDRSGWKLRTEARRLHLLGIGDVKVNLHRELRGTPKALTVKRGGRHWYASIRCVGVEPRPLPSTGRQVGLDLGVVNLVATSDGELLARAASRGPQRRRSHTPSATSRPRARARIAAGEPASASVGATDGSRTSAATSPTSSLARSSTATT